MGKGSFIKILSLTIGLTIGLVLLARVRLELNYNSCVKDIDNVYKLSEYIVTKTQGEFNHGQTSGGTAPKLREYVPEIVECSRNTFFTAEAKLVFEDGRKVKTRQMRFADSCHFQFFDTKVTGDVRKALSVKGQCMVSKSLADKIGGDVIGKYFYVYPYDSIPLTIGGIYDDYADNSSYSDVDVFVSLPSIGYYSYDGSSNLMGNDRYNSYVRLVPNANLEKVQHESDKMIEKELASEMKYLAESGHKGFHYIFNNLAEERINNAMESGFCIILAIVAIVILFTAIMNYILVVIGTLAGKAKQVAVQKSMGAHDSEFYKETFKDAAIHLCIALAFMTFIILVGQDLIKTLLGVSLGTLFSSQTLFVVLGVCVIVLLTCALLPGYIYSHISVTFAFRHFSESKRIWKLSLLAFQFALSALLFVVLTTVYRQYDYMLNKDLGYDYKNVVYTHYLVSAKKAKVLMDEANKLSFVESSYLSYSLFFDSQSGDNISIVGHQNDLFNAANMFFATSGIIRTMGLTIVKGRGFSERPDSATNEVLVDENFARRVKKQEGIDNVIGLQVTNSSFGDIPFTIVGVVKDFTICDLNQRDERPLFVINGSRWTSFAVFKLQSLTAENIIELQRLCDRLYPDDEMTIMPYSELVHNGYDETQHMRDLIIIGCIATFLITLIGLIGYISDEVQRRSRELAIRKVLGASVLELQMLWIRSIAVIALPSTIFGAMVGFYCNSLIMEQFPDKVDMPVWTYIGPLLFAIIVTMIVICCKTYKVATLNPVESIKTE